MRARTTSPLLQPQHGEEIAHLISGQLFMKSVTCGPKEIRIRLQCGEIDRQPGQFWRTDTDINLNPVTPPGSYDINLSVAAPGSDQPWADQAGSTSTRITSIIITP